MRALALLALPLLFACDGRPRTTPSAPDDRVTGPYVAVFDLTGGAPEQASGGFLGVGPRDRTFDQVLRELRLVRKDKDAKGIFVRFGELGMARAYELGRAFGDARAAGMPVHCHADGLSNAAYMAAAIGCSKIFISPAGEVETVGIAAQIIYLRKLLSEELKLSIDILQVGKFKGAEEPLTRDGPSPEARASLEGYLVDIRKTWVQSVEKARGAECAKAIEDGPYGPERAQERHLIDGVAYADDVTTKLREETKAVREKVVYGRGAVKGDDEDLGELVRSIAGAGGGRGPVALVRATGSIGMGGGGGLGGDSGISESELAPVLEKLENDDSVKAVVVRIDSPGGSALASDLLWHRLMRIRKKKPLVFSVGEMAASGGYYLASSGNFIIADPVSLLGSIGVVGGKVGIGNGLERFGVHVEVFPAKKDDPKAGNRAAYMSPFVSWDEDTKVRVRDSMESIYHLFLARVAEGRGITSEKVAENAEGKIFSGDEAKRLGMVDELGGLEDAIAKARTLAKLPADARVHVVSPGGGALEQILGSGGGDARAPISGAEGMALRALLPASTAAFVTGYAPLLRGERALTTLPFGIVVQ